MGLGTFVLVPLSQASISMWGWRWTFILTGALVLILILIYGFLEAGIGLAGALGAWLAGFIFDRTYSYTMVFVLVIVVLLLSSVFVWLAAPRKFRHA